MHRQIAAIWLISLAVLGGALTPAPSAAAAITNKDAVAVIIGNRDYAGSVPDVDFAHNDAQAMKRFVVDVLGFREGNVIELLDATLANFFSTFGNRDDHQGKLWNWVKQGESDVVVFYSGHGVPGQSDGRGYLLPVNADPDTPEINGYPVDLLYHNLQRIGARSVTVYLDACFTGDSPNGKLTRAASSIGLAHVPGRLNAAISVLTAARGDQLASWDETARHGLFTAYLLKGLYGAADREGFGNEDGAVTLGEIRSYLDDEMTYAARRGHQREQNVTVRGDDALVLALLAEDGPREPPQIAETAAPPTLESHPHDPEDGTGRRGNASDVRPLDVQAVTKIATDVYAGPSSLEAIVAHLPAGRNITVTGRTLTGRWYRVALPDGGSGYLSRRTLRRADIAGDAGADAPANQQPPVRRGARPLTKAAALYSLPSLMSSVITRIPAGGRVQIIRRSLDPKYVEVRYRGRLGYVLSSLLAKPRGGRDGP